MEASKTQRSNAEKERDARIIVGMNFSLTDKDYYMIGYSLAAEIMVNALRETGFSTTNTGSDKAIEPMHNLMKHVQHLRRTMGSDIDDVTVIRKDEAKPMQKIRKKTAPTK